MMAFVPPIEGIPLATDVIAGDAQSGAIFNHPNVDRATLRYALWRTWDAEVKPLVFIGLNPSTATHEVDDPTVRRCIGFARDRGHGGLVMLNLFSFRSTDPAALDHRNQPKGSVQAREWPVSVTGGARHDAYLKFFTAQERAAAVIAGWGNHGWIAGRGPTVVDMLRKAGVTLLCLGVNKNRAPKHPLYLPKIAQPVLYEGYR